MTPATWLVGGVVVLAVLLLGRPAPVTPERPPVRWLLLLPLALAALMVPPGAALAVAVVALGGRAWWRQRHRTREAEVTAGRVLEACELMAAEVAAGQPPGTALGHASATWPPLADAARADGLGSDVPASLRRLALRPGAAELRLVAAAWDVAHRSGGGLADGLGRVAGSLRAARATRLVVEGELASARATARLVAALPVLVLLLAGGPGGGAWSFLLDTPAGWACLVAGLGLGLLGLWWIERLAAAVLR